MHDIHIHYIHITYEHYACTHFSRGASASRDDRHAEGRNSGMCDMTHCVEFAYVNCIWC